MQFASVLDVPEFYLAPLCERRSARVWIFAWSIHNGEQCSIFIEACALANSDFIGRREASQLFSTRTLKNRKHTRVEPHHRNGATIRTHDSESLSGRVGRDANTATSAQIPTRAAAGKEFRTVSIERDVVSHVGAAAEVRESFAGFGFPNDRVCVKAAGRNSFSVFAEVDRRICYCKGAAVWHCQRRQLTKRSGIPNLYGVASGEGKQSTVAAESNLRIFLSGWSKFAFIFSSEVPQFEMLFMYAGGEHVSVRIECKLNALDLVARNLHVPNVTTA